MCHRISCKLSNNALTYSSRVATDINLHESPEASFDQYLEDKPRVFNAIFPDKRRSQQLNDEEWRIHMLPVRFLLVTCSPVIDMRLRCKSDGYDYPTGVPPQVTKVLDLTIVQWELHGLEDIVRPSVFSLSVNGTLYPCRQENNSRLKGQLSMSMTFDLPPVLSFIPEDVRRNVAETLLKRLEMDLKEKVNRSLLADYSKFKSEQPTKGLANTRVSNRALLVAELILQLEVEDQDDSENEYSNYRTNDPLIPAHPS
ncbi:putative pentatricopeptide repeat-containing protein, mitochondrial-like protein [Tanacetum coccineum]|uniref:Pentatricopeptide repeat-containing protein, mitochondrial-like protein n=1 Tax=Tanacetum coccineum TaxID=301880 RepID=A0ABQ4X5P6_9ASTR